MILINNLDEFKSALAYANEKLVVIDTYANWCGPCKQIAPFYEELSKKYTNVLFIKVNIDDSEDIAEHLGVKSLPTFYFYKNSSKIDILEGANRQLLENCIIKHK